MPSNRGNPAWRDPKYLEYLRRARRKLEGFQRWLVRGSGLAEDRADVNVALVCRAVWEASQEGEGDPLDHLANPMLSKPSYSQLKAALKRYYTWQLVRKSSSDAEKASARRQLGKLAVMRGPGGLLQRQRGHPTVPLPQEQFRKLMRSLPAWCKKMGPRWPWARGVLGIRLKAAPLIRSELVWVQRSDLVRARVDGPKWGTIQLWRKTKRAPRSKIIPLALIEEEVDFLTDWPWEWGTLADLVAPTTRKRSRGAKAANLIGQATQAFVEDTTGIRLGPNDTPSLQWATYVWLLKWLKGDWLSLARISGVSETRLRDHPDLLKVIS